MNTEIMSATKYTYTEKSPIEGEFEISIDSNMVQSRMDAAYHQLQKTVKLKGFRPGKVPMNIVRQRYRNEVIRDVFERLVGDSCRGAAIEKKLPIIGEPRVQKTNWLKWEEGQEMEYTASIELVPDPDLKKYKKLAISVLDREVDAADVEKTIQNLLESKAELKEVEKSRPVREGDFVFVDFQGFLEGKELEDAKATNFQMEMGGQNALPEFQDGILTMKVGEEKEIDVPYPAEYSNKEIAGKKVQYKVKLLEIKTKEYPELNDEIAKEFNFDSVADFKAKIRESLEQDVEYQRKNEVDDKIVNALIEANPMEIPESLKNHQLNVILRDVSSLLHKQQYSDNLIQEYLQKNMNEFKLRADKEVKLALLLPKVVEAEKVECEDADLEKRFEEIAQNAGKPVDEIKQQADERGTLENIKSQVRREKAIDLMVQAAKVTKETAK